VVLRDFEYIGRVVVLEQVEEWMMCCVPTRNRNAIQHNRIVEKKREEAGRKEERNCCTYLWNHSYPKEPHKI
jgi:hypothetical protein